jgi:AcrR family transcriptional regulator
MARTTTTSTAASKTARTKTVVAKTAGTPRRAGDATHDVATAQVIPLPERPATPVVRRRRSNRRSEQTVEKILSCTETIILESGAERISVLDVCRAADISRGTFYRYFASQDELLDAFSRHKRERFHRALKDVVAPHDDPDARFAAVIGYLDHYLQHGNARRLLIVAPEYAVGFFRRIFHDSVVRFQDVLGLVFDAWDERLGIQLDRELIAEMLIRYVLSEQLVPSDGDRKSLPRRIGRMVDALLLGAPARARR